MIYLKKIEIYGFKSFADKLELQFDQPITGIVGPNGCGKSNVSDAIRWVLGEQSTRQLRGKLMQDLIFSGTDTRKSMSYCEVSLFIDNTTRIFPIQMDEIIISRKLYRNNESHYYLNRNIVRLKDILAMLRNVGLGREGYSIVGQGRMDAILSAKPEDRRAIFEEALSISGFRIKKNETERKLEKTAENIRNLSVLEKELSDRIGPLKKQASTAKKYLELEDQLRYHEINAYIYGYDSSSILKEKSRDKIAGLREELIQKETDSDKVNENYDQLFHQVTDIDGTITKMRDRQLELSIELEKQAGDSKVLGERVKSLASEISNTQQQIQAFSQQKQSLETELAETKITLEKRLVEQQNLDGEVAVLSDKLQSFNKKTDQAQHDLDIGQQSYSQLQSAISECNQKRAVCLAETQSLNSRLEKIQQQQSEITHRLTSLNSEEGSIIEHFEQAKKQREQLLANIEQTKTEIKNSELEIFEQSKVLKKIQQEVSGISGGIEFLKDFSANYKGYFASVQNLMQDCQTNSELSSKICGVVANLLKVDPHYQVAIETALGSRLQNVVTKDETDAKFVISYLKLQGYGRVTFLPISSMKAHDIEAKQVLKEKGVLGVANQLVSYEKRFSSVFDSLLGGIIVVDTYDNAIAISKKYRYTHKIVTLTGERISNDGSIEGGSKKSSNASLLSYETQISQRQEILQEKTAVLNAEEQKAQSLEQRLILQNQKFQQLQQALSNINIDIATDREKIEASNIFNNSDKKSILNLESEKEQILEKLASLAMEVEQCQSTLNSLTEQEALQNYNLQAMKATIQTNNASKGGLQEELTSKQFRLASLNSNIEVTKKAIENLNLAIYKLDDQSSQKSTYLNQIEQALEILKSQIASSETDCQSRTELQQLIEQIQSSDQMKRQLNEDFQAISNKRMQLSTELETVRSAIDKEEFILSRIDEDLQELQQRVYEQYGITYSAAMEKKDENYNLAESKQKISDLRVNIQKLGYVNVNAIEELAEVEQRFGDIGGHMEDLQKAENDLKDILKNLTSEIETRFEEGLTQINENFKVVFRELFKGGNAKLILDKDPEKSALDYGIEIEAQPPGKRLQNISLLSGGERTLTAAAILFAILKLHPMPFCVLDEIEAALDDTNAERIARYLRKFSDQTQFVVITHKKPTMENSDVLYGVTMEEKGVSKIVSVKLSDAVKEAG